MFSKAQIFNLALNSLLLSRQISDTDTDKSVECKVLNQLWEIAFTGTLQDLDLDSTSVFKPLELLSKDLTSHCDDMNKWTYIYRYPDKCTFFRRVRSPVRTDDRWTRIPLRIGLWDSPSGPTKVIFTNEINAVGEWIPTELPISTLDPCTCLAIAIRLAFLAAPLITGKGANSLRKSLEAQYVMHKSDAQGTDRLENTNFESEATMSEFVKTRLS